MKVSNSGSVPVYTVSGASGLALPEWLSRRRKNPRRDPEQANRVELLQDFEFDGHSACIRISEDGNYIMSTGAYKVRVCPLYAAVCLSLLTRRRGTAPDPRT